MLKTTFTLISKKQLTHDVYELVYTCSDLIRESPKSWQYVMFQLLPWLNRAYSIASFWEQDFTLIIKRIPDGKGSPMICDAEIGMIFSGMLPLWHFVLHDTPISKCFIWTGTWFAPLYCQMLGCLRFRELHFGIGDWIDFLSWIAFVFWVREYQDVFYSSEIQELGSHFDDFEYLTYLSREEREGYKKGYVTDWIIPENIAKYEEFYLCGSPVMVKWAREKLEALGIEKEKIFWEQF